MSRALVAGQAPARRLDPEGAKKRAAISASLRRAVEDTAHELARVEQSLKKLDATLDDPALAAAYPPDHPQRIAAMNRHIELWFVRNRLRAKLREDEKDADRLWAAMSMEERADAALVWGADAGWTHLGPAVNGIILRVAPFRGFFERRPPKEGAR